MAFGVTPKDGGTIPIACVYVPGVGFVALQGAPAAAADGSGNSSTTAVMTLGGPPATSPFQASVTPYGELRVAEDATQLFQEGFDTATLDITNKWKAPVAAGGGVAATNQLTATVLATGTTANGYSYLESAVTFPPVNPGWLQFYTGINIPFPTVINQYFFWGLGTSPATPTAAVPLTNACGFELYTDGKLYCVTYQSGARVVIQDLSIATGNGKQPQNASTHKYYIFYRGDNIYFSIDNPDAVVASTTTGAPGPDVNILPIKFTAIAGAVAPLSSGLLQVNVATLSDTGRNRFRISDGTYPWRQATVDALGNLATGNNLYNGATFEPARNNVNTAALITAVGATTTQNSADITNYNGRGVAVTLNMTSAGTGNVTLFIQGKDPTSGQYYTILSGAAVTTNVANTYTVYPGITTSANVNVNNVLPRTWKVQVFANNANATSYTVGSCIIV